MADPTGTLVNLLMGLDKPINAEARNPPSIGKHLVMKPWILFQRKQVQLKFSLETSGFQINASSRQDRITPHAENSGLEEMGG